VPYSPQFELSTFEALDPSWKRGILGGLVEVLVRADRAYLRSYPATPPLYRSGVHYVFNRDRWQDIPTTLARREGDCKDFSAWRIAEYRREGIPAAVDVTVRTTTTKEGQKFTIYHVRVRLPRGLAHVIPAWARAKDDHHVEDPSRALGMGRIEDVIHRP
jgi:hypothetical protein